MRKIKFLVLVLMALPLVFVSCNENETPNPVSYVEDGFYVVGEATAVADLFATNADLGLMAPGINEVDGAVRSGMYEKYIALEGGKPFFLMQKAGLNEIQYGATLAKVGPLEGSEEPPIEVFKGTMTEKGTLQVAESGLYHVVLDLNLKAILIAPAEWGIRGAMNGWGFTAFPKPAFNKTTMTYKLSNVTVEYSGGFKFAYGGGWKIELSGEEVKANTNLGNDGGEKNGPLTAKLTPGGPDIGIERAIWSMELTWNLAKGPVKDCFEVKVVKVDDLPTLDYPENLYAIGSFATTDEEPGGWQWSSEHVITMVPAHSHPYAFWAITHFDAGTEFKFSPEKAWSGDFGASGAASDDVYAKGGDNIKVEEAGYYLIYVDLKEEKIFVGEPSVYLMGACAKDGEWESGVPENKFDIGATGLTKTTFNAGELRIYASCPIADGVDWWQMEFMIFDGKIEYRGAGDDQARVNVDAGQLITLEFKTGTGTIE